MPRRGFHFDRPLVLLQSDDWGRVGLRDVEGFAQLRSAQINLGERPYDFYTLETADDVGALQELLGAHHDSIGRTPCLEMNFVTANLDFRRMKADDFSAIHLLPLPDGLPEGWNRPGLFEAYRRGIAAGVFHPALHGTTHFCRHAIERHLNESSERGRLLKTLWQAGTPYIHWRMPWVGFEYWDPEGAGDRFISREKQLELIGQTVGGFSRMFSTLPHSACAPGYRANEHTNQAWARYGIEVAQNGPGRAAPYFGHDSVLQLTRNIEFEPAVDPGFSVEACLLRSDECFRRGIPAIVSVHSINFHSSVKDFRSWTLTQLNELFSALETRYPDLLYVHDYDLLQIIKHGGFESQCRKVAVKVTGKMFRPGGVSQGVEA